jgi:hypothetical protein
MMHVEKLAERILFLKGEVEMKASNNVQKTQVVKKCWKWQQVWRQGVLKITTNGQSNDQKTPIQLPKRFLKHWLTMKNSITISTTRKWKTS